MPIGGEFRPRLSHQKITGAVQSVLEFDLWELLVGRTLKDDILPGNQVATVLWTLGAELIQIQKPDDWGGGIMSF